MERPHRKEPRWDLEACARTGNAADLALSEASRQAHFPEKGTRFETRDTANLIANAILKAGTEWRVESLEEQFVVRTWPTGTSPISEYRRWMKVRKPHMKRKPNGNQKE